jgi:hypothetical protein
LLIPEVSAKGLALLKEAVPALTEVAVFWNAANSVNSIVLRDVEATARAIGLALHPQQVFQALAPPWLMSWQVPKQNGRAWRPTAWLGREDSN